MKRDDDMEPVFILDEHLTPKEALELFRKALNELEEEKKKEQNKKS